VPVDNAGAFDDGLSGPARDLAAAVRIGVPHRRVAAGPGVDDGTGVRSRLVHSTASLDYALVLRGSIWSVMDADERELTAGDVADPARHQSPVVQPLRRAMSDRVSS